MATFILTEDIKNIFNSPDVLDLLRDKGYVSPDEFSKDIIKRLNAFDSSLNLKEISYHSMNDTDKYIGVILDKQLNKKYNVCVIPPQLGTRSGFLTQQIFGFLSDILLSSLPVKLSLLSDVPVIIINCMVGTIANSAICNVISAKKMGFHYIDMFNRQEDFGHPVRNLREYMSTIEKFKDINKDFLFEDNCVVFKTERLKNLAGSLTNEPYYFAINAYPALILAYKEGIKIDISAFDDWYNQPKRNKNILAFVEMAKNLQKRRKTITTKKLPLQQIYYGAPGTGKSHETNKIAKTFPNTIRTTFHPDSDYSTFVGAYKPTTTTNYKYGLDRNGNTVPIGLNTDENGKTIPFEEKKVEYKFVKQSFLKAYIKAWKSFKETCVDGGEIAPQFLIIEEINRGNCAQIFGDLFQLLDRNKEGFSEYPIETDEDIVKALLEDKPEDKLSFGMKGLELLPEQMNYINSVFNKDSGLELNVAEKICKGEVLVLPCNFYIWATMNTSDQSLFPIDSAFKRRWEWKYMKIREGKDENGEVLNWKIIVKDKDKNNVNILGREDLSWWEFIQKINEIIASMTLSADKQLGYFFCKAKEGVIDERTFVGKVIFYLWNDVFKDYGFEDSYLFRYKTTVNGNEVEKDLTFPDFYDEDGENIDSVRLVDFIERVMNWKKTNQESD